MTYKIYTRKKIKDCNYDIIVETVNQKPDIKTVRWFGVTKNKEIIPYVVDESSAAKAHKGAGDSDFRKIQYQLFIEYFNLSEKNKSVPYKYTGR